jgi:hypothetical protein
MGREKERALARLEGKITKRRLFHNIPEEHRISDDSRLEWLWMQSVAQIMSIRENTDDIRDRMAATLMLTAAWMGQLSAIELVLQRLEGAAVDDKTISESETLVL